MGILVGLFQQIREWDRPSQIALALDVVLLMGALVVLGNVPELRTPATGAVIGLVLMLQVIVLWGNRRMVTAFTQAQNLFRAGEIDQARQVLEKHIAEREAKKQGVKVDVLVLLGNLYRVQGAIEASEALLRQANVRAPRYHFALYGLGRTLLVKGEFEQAAALIEQALNSGAPDTVLHDLALARFCMGETSDAREALLRVTPTDDPARRLMAAYINQQEIHLEPEMLLFWQGEYERFAATQYGKFLREFLDAARIA